MEVILKEDVLKLGHRGDVVKVADGYGRNYLVPRGMATVPTAHNLRLLERYKIRVKQALDARVADLKALGEMAQSFDPGDAVTTVLKELSNDKKVDPGVKAMAAEALKSMEGQTWKGDKVLKPEKPPVKPVKTP